MADPLAGSAWSKPATVAGFVTSPPNATLLRLAGEELRRSPACRALDLGCGAARNAVPLAMQGWRVLGLDLSLPMLQAARERMRAELDSRHRLQLALSPMDRLPVADRSCELVVAHGIWNLARSSAEFRAAVREAARVSADGAALFVFTFSRDTLAGAAEPVAGESFVFEDAQGERHVFLTANQLVGELHEAGFALDAAVPLREVNPRASNRLITIGSPVIWEGAFRFKATQ